MPAPHDLPHTIDVDEAGWQIQHYTVCQVNTPRDGRRTVCLIEDLAAEQSPHLEHTAGRYVATTDEDGTRLELTPANRVSA